MAELIAVGDLPAAERLAHTVKGVAGNLGAGPVQAAAGAIEKAIAGRASGADLAPLLHMLSTRLEELLAPLRPLLVEEIPAVAAAPAPLDLGLARLVVAELLVHLASFDAAATDCLDANRAVLGGLFAPEDLTRFEERLCSYSFVEAQKQLEDAARAKGIPTA